MKELYGKVSIDDCGYFMFLLCGCHGKCPKLRVDQMQSEQCSLTKLYNYRYFTVTHSFDQEKTQQDKVTASTGIATAPDDAENSLSLIRHAVRALYVGSKRAVRNRVAKYRHLKKAVKFLSKIDGLFSRIIIHTFDKLKNQLDSPCCSC